MKILKKLLGLLKRLLIRLKRHILRGFSFFNLTMILIGLDFFTDLSDLLIIKALLFIMFIFYLRVNNRW
jgi:hypothetical protein